MRIAKILGVHPDQARSLTSASQYAIWEAEFNIEWQRADRLSYEFALLRHALDGLFTTPKELEHYMLPNRLKLETPYSHMSEEEREEKRQQSKSELSQFGFRMEN